MTALRAVALDVAVLGAAAQAGVRPASSETTLLSIGPTR